jgi:ATP-binding protein involved in chromosome partitioning
MKAGNVTRVPVPHAITRLDEGVLVEWDERGHTYLYEARSLRLACPCAECVEEMSGRPLLDPGAIPADIRPVSIALVGAYGLRIVWSDGHSTGIQTFEGLRRDCGCPRCGPAGPG